MKKFAIAIIVASLTCAGFAAHSQNYPDGVTVPTGTALQEELPYEYQSVTNLNYVRTFVPRDYQTNPASVDENSSVPLTAMSTKYIDGFGRPIEDVNRAPYDITKDVIMVHDNRPGSSSLNFLPYSIAWGNGHFRSTPFTEQQSYYSSLYPNESTTGSSPTGTTVAAYAKTEYTSSANDRTSWVYGAGKSGLTVGHGSSTTAAFNVSNEVFKWTFDFQSYLPAYAGYYNAGELIKKISLGPNGERTEEFFDANGNMVCKKAYDNKAIASNPIFDVTCYIYDNLGRQVMMLTPKAVEYATTYGASMQTIVDNLCSYNKYDNYGRAYEQHIAGQLDASGNALNTYTIYDKLSRPILVQTPILRQQNKWRYIQYDQLGRIITAGLFTDATYTRANIQNWFDGTASLPSGFNTTNSIIFYLFNASAHGQYPSTLNDAEELEIYYYDNYNYSAAASRSYDYTMFFGNMAGGTVTSAGPVVSDNVYGKLTGKQIKVLKPAGSSLSDWITSIYFYDTYDNILQVQTQNQLGGWDYVSTDYDYNGRILDEVTYHENPACSTKTNTLIANKYVYNLSTYQLIQVKQKIDNGSWTVLSDYLYDQLGNIVSNHIGSVENQVFERGIDGSLTGINKAYAEGATTPDVSFGESIKYDHGFSQSLFGGKVSGIIWRGAGSSPSRAYGYSYDMGGRLSQADFAEYGIAPGGSSSTWNNQNTDFSVSNLKYDENGNIASLKRMGMVWTNTSSGYQLLPQTVDDLLYRYQDVSNALDRVTDNVTTNFGSNDFYDGNPSGTDYGYDVSGNLSSDNNKGISNVAYNFLDLPTNVTFSGSPTKTIDYIYDALGNKLQEKIFDGSATTTLDYVGPFVYSNSSMQYLLHREGKASYETNASTGLHEWVNYYFVKDHLGNVRSVVKPIEINPMDYMATHELAVRNDENLLFARIDDVQAPLPGSSQSGPRGALLDATYSEKRIGTSILLHVMAGDKIELSTDYYYDHYDTSTAQQTAPEDMLASLTGALSGGITGLGGGEGMNTQVLIDGLFNGGAFLNAYESMKFDVLDPSKPQAFLNYVVFDEQMRIVPEESGVIQVGAADAWGNISTSGALNLTHDGYVAVYISNATDKPVYFDNIFIRFFKGGLVDEQHYYPYGLPIFSGVTNPLERKYLYQTKEWRSENDLKWCDFHARQYDPQLGRFLSIDPGGQFNSGYIGMGNNPVVIIDPSGKWIHILIGALVGGAINLGIKAMEGKIGSFKDGLVAFGIGAGAGALAAATGGAAFLAAGGGAAGAGGFVAGAIASGTGAGFGSVFQSVGNSAYFHDPLITPKQLALTMSLAALSGGVLNGTLAAMNGKPFMTGELPQPTALQTSSPLPDLQPTKNTEITVSNSTSPSELGNASSYRESVYYPRSIPPSTDGSYSVYHGLDNEGVVRYTGITRRLPEIRFGEHLNSLGTGKELLRYEVMEGATNLTRDQARILEQTIINQYGLQNQGGQLLNKINSIAPQYWPQYGIQP